MTGWTLALLLVTVGSAPTGDSDAFIRASLSDSALVAIASQYADSLRLALSRTRAAAAQSTSDSAANADIAFANRLAAAYQQAWMDSFYVRELARFKSEPVAWRREWARADSLRRGGINAATRVGVPAAMRLWRESATIFSRLRDSAGLGAALGSLGAGFYLAGQLDSAAPYLDRARLIAVTVGDRRTEANALGVIASVEKDEGDLRAARDSYERALALRARCGDDRGAAADENNLGLLAQSLGDLGAARRAFVRALEANRRGGRDHSAAINLTNLANLASVTGDSPGADSLYRRALAMHAALAERDDQAIVLHDLALLQMRRADFEGAFASFERALSLTDSTGAVREHAALLADLATLLAARGDLSGAMTTLRRAEQSAAGDAGSGELRARLALIRADLDVALNALADAERGYERAARLAAASGNKSLQGEAERGRGMMLIKRERYADAVVELAAAVRHQQTSGDVRAAAAGRLLLGYAYELLDDTARARHTLSAARSALHALGDPAAEAAAYAALGDLDVANGAAAAAESDYRRGLDVLGAITSPDVRWRLHAGLAEAARKRGGLEEARDEFRLAITSIERTSGSLRLEEQRESFHADKWDVYAQLALTEQQLRRPDEAFAASERLRAQQSLAMLARGRVRFAPTGDSLLVREQELRHRIAELTRLVENGPGSPVTLRGAAADAPARDAARQALSAAERDYAALLQEMRETSATGPPRRLPGRAPDVASWREISGHLHPEEALLEYLVTDSASTLFIVTADTVVALDLGVGRHEIAALVEYTRDAIARSGRGADSSWRAPLRRLYQLLLQPAEDAALLRGRRTLIVVPHVELHFAPFAAFMPSARADHFLIERFAISYAPSATLWLRFSQRSVAIGEGHSLLAMAPRTHALPASGAEVDSLGAILGARAIVLRDADATRAAFLARAPTSEMVHVDSLGVLNKHNPLFSFVELAPDGQDDGRLAVTDIFGLDLHARLVTLSACQTALGAGALADVPAGDEWVGFTSAFLQAGARDVLASLWPVEDAATAELMARFYRALSEDGDAAEALAIAQRQSISDPATAIPFRWAGFVVTGAR
jgi:CHAT domain-containing protein/Tfp pilus assembly protein PilF